MSKPKIGILGTGDVGRSLAIGFTGAGHEVKIGSREATSEKALGVVKAAGQRASAGTFADAAKFGDVLVLALAWSGTENAINLAGHDNFTGKVVIDAVNPLKVEPNKGPQLAIGHTDSAGERIQRWLPKARIVKAFNTVGHAHMVKPSFPGGPPDMFIAGDDDEAKRTVTGICETFGWPTIDIGGIEGARLLEPMCILWVGYGIRTGTWNHAFKLLRK